MDPALWGYIGLIALLVLNGFFATARGALTRVRRQDLREEAEEGSSSARLALTLAEDSTRVLSTFRLAILLGHFLVAALAAVLLVPPGAQWLRDKAALTPFASNVVTFVVLIPLAALVMQLLTEALPEALVQRSPVGWATALALPSQVVMTTLSPLVTVTTELPRRILAAPGDPDSTSLVTEEEIMTLVDAGEEGGSIEQEEKEMIYSIFQLDETHAREIMVPRIDVVALDIDTSLEEARDRIIEAGHSRIPVYEETLDHVRGLLYAKDLLEVWNAAKPAHDLGSLLRPVPFVPESKRASDLLRELQTAKVHMAIVIDEYGGTAGLVTIEDIVEEIVGEIFDEYDEEAEADYEAVGDHEYIFDGRIDLDDFNRLLGTDLPTELGDTLGGYIYGQLGKVPDVGEVIETGLLRIEVLSLVDRRIRKVQVKQLLAEEAPPDDPDHEPNSRAQLRNGHGRNGH